ncbi:hypothetical protein HU200_062318 [Digitaria exilis]|uniref:B box-type domain-containing protein n=1 Tax=Digitaria exilis TaxID=1010633 RepID=A0A835A672_9POAL|nr:hypothetical protein HU200_062318 [Digitaria exilis]
MKIQCDACEGAAATVVCCADEAALCARCDVEIHAANKLASKHQRLPLEALSSRLPRCDVCQEKAAFIFCVEDRRSSAGTATSPSTSPARSPATTSATSPPASASASPPPPRAAPPPATPTTPTTAHRRRPPSSRRRRSPPSPPRRSRCPRRRSSCRRAGPSTSSCSSPTTSPATSCRRSRLSGSRSWSGSPTSTSSRRPPRPAGRWRRSRSFSDPRRQTTRRATGRAKQLPGQGCARTRRHGSRSLTTRMITSSSLILVKKERESFV